VTEARPSRRRRSVARSPALVDPADVPEDAPGRVALIAVRAPADTHAEGEAQTAAPPSGARAARFEGLIAAYDGWLVVGLVAAALLVIFIVGMAVTR
jgi:hypothetical protein